MISAARVKNLSGNALAKSFKRIFACGLLVPQTRLAGLFVEDHVFIVFTDSFIGAWR